LYGPEWGYKLKSDFIASLSHEIRTPLNAIIGFSEQLKKTALNDKQSEYLEIIENSSAHLLDLVNEILTFSKPDSGEIRLDIVDFSLESLLYEIYNAFRIKAENKKINFRYHFDQRLKLIFRGDAFRLKQIINNLVSNAIKFTDYGFVELFVPCVKPLSGVSKFYVLVPLKFRENVFPNFMLTAPTLSWVT